MRRSLVAVATLTILAAPAWARAADRIGYQGWGPRVGLSSGPDQVHFGAHIDFGTFAQHFRLQPNVEIGVGSGRTLTAFNLETSYRFASTWGAWSPYAGGGLGLDMTSGDEVPGRSNEELGASVLGGIEKGLARGDRFFVETKLGVDHAPDVKFTVGWTFY